MRTVALFLLPWLPLLPLCCALGLEWCGTQVEPLDLWGKDGFQNDLCLANWPNGGENQNTLEGFVRRVADECYNANGKGDWFENKAAGECTVSTVIDRGCYPREINEVKKYPVELICEYYREKVNEAIRGVDDDDAEQQKMKYNTMLTALKDCKAFHFECLTKYEKKKSVEDSHCDSHGKIIDDPTTECSSQTLTKFAEKVLEKCSEDIITDSVDERRTCLFNTIFHKCPEPQVAMEQICKDLGNGQENCLEFSQECFKKLLSKNKGFIPATRPTKDTTWITTPTTKNNEILIPAKTSTPNTFETTRRHPTKIKSNTLPKRKLPRGMNPDYYNDDSKKNDDYKPPEEEYDEDDDEIPKKTSTSLLSRAISAAVSFFLWM